MEIEVLGALPLAILDGGILVVLFMVAAGVVSLGAFVFWIAMIIECATREPSEGNDKLIWILVLIFLGIIGAALYFFIRRPERITQHGR